MILQSCPACGSALIEHKQPTPDEYEWWRFDCDAEVVRMEKGHLYDEAACGNALRIALAKLTVTADEE